MSASLTTALEQLDKAIVAVDQAFAQRLARLERQKHDLAKQVEAEREKNISATKELSATINQLESYLGRTTVARTGT